MSPSPALSLGVRLAQTQQAEENNTRALAEARAQAASAEELKKFRLVEAFFEKAKAYFSEGILAGSPTAKLSIMVGSEFRGQRDNVEVEPLICGYCNDSKARVLDPKHPYHSLWQAFEAWCVQNDLTPTWHYEYDGGGMSSWYRLRVSPQKGIVTSSVGVSKLSDVRQKHDYCLSVLATMADGFVKAMDLLERQSQGRPVGPGKSKLVPLLDSAKQLKTLLAADSSSLAT